MRFLNPFATIRDLRSEMKSLRFALSNAAESNLVMRRSRDVQLSINRDLVELLDTSNQAIDAFMAEREELKHVGIMACHDVLRLAEIVADLDAEADSLDEQLRQQAGDTLEVISHVKKVDAALAACGITIEGGPEGVIVVADQRAFVGAARNGFSSETEDGNTILRMAA